MILHLRLQKYKKNEITNPLALVLRSPISLLMSMIEESVLPIYLYQMKTLS